MKSSLLRICFCTLLTTAVIVSCKKKKDDASPDDTAEQMTNGGDDARVQAETDAVINDADAALGANGQTRRTAAPYSSYALTNLCDVNVDASDSMNKQIVLKYYGYTNCFSNRTRLGTVTLQLLNNAKWSDAGAVLKITYNNLAINRTSDNSTLFLSGTTYVKNVTGGTIYNMPSTDTIQHRITSNNLQLQFDDGTRRTWSICKLRTVTHPSSDYIVTTTGDSTINHVSGIALAGTTRLGSLFTSLIDPNNPIVWNNNVCGTEPVSGTRTISGISRSLTMTFGVTSSKVPVTMGCSLGVYLDWTLDGNTKNAYVTIY